MTSLYDLWDEEKYSEGDPIRQLIGATKGIKDWPMDAVAWGADTVDLLTAGLAHIAKQNPGLAKAIKTDLGGNLRRSTKEGYDRPTMTQGPSPDVEEGRSVGRMLNPFLWAGGQKIPTPKMDIMNFNPARRAFLSARDAAYKQPIPEAAENLGNAAGALLSVPMDRRTFNKGAVAAGGVAATGLGGLKLIERFAPEAKRIAEAAPKVAEDVSKYRYNSLKEYLDDVVDYSNDIAHERSYEAAMENGFNNSPDLDRYMDDFVDNFDNSKIQRERLLADETAYKEAKRNLSSLSPKKDPKTGLPPQSQRDLIDSFSPQAKKEMKELKSLTKQIDNDYASKHDWTEWLIKNSDDPSRLIEDLKKYYIP